MLRERLLTNVDREQWIDNDEGLYRWWKSSRLSRRDFIHQEREHLDACIANILSRAYTTR